MKFKTKEKNYIYFNDIHMLSKAVKQGNGYPKSG